MPSESASMVKYVYTNKEFDSGFKLSKHAMNNNIQCLDISL